MDTPCQGISRARGTTWTCTTQTTYRERGQKALPARRSFPPNYTRLRNDGLSLKGTCWKIWFLTWICCWSKLILCCCCRSCCCCLAICGETKRTQWDPGWEGQPSTHQRLDMMLTRRCKHHSSWVELTAGHPQGVSSKTFHLSDHLHPIWSLNSTPS